MLKNFLLGIAFCAVMALAVTGFAQTFTNADLAGAYAAGSLSLENFEAADGEAYINVFSVTFDGAGSWSGTYTDFSSSGGSGAGAISGTYAVNADGSFDWVITSFVPNETYTGHISSSGDVLILSGGETVGVDIRQNIGVAVKKQEDGDSVNTISGGGGEG